MRKMFFVIFCMACFCTFADEWENYPDYIRILTYDELDTKEGIFDGRDLDEVLKEINKKPADDRFFIATDEWIEDACWYDNIWDKSTRHCPYDETKVFPGVKIRDCWVDDPYNFGVFYTINDHVLSEKKEERSPIEKTSFCLVFYAVEENGKWIIFYSHYGIVQPVAQWI